MLKTDGRCKVKAGRLVRRLMGAQRAGWETGSWGRRSGIRSPAELINQCKEASVNQLVFIELKSVEHNVERGRWS